MRTYFERRPFRFFSYRDDREDFGPATRTEYFASIPDEERRTLDDYRRIADEFRRRGVTVGANDHP
jgi:hypothetical protein